MCGACVTDGNWMSLNPRPELLLRRYPQCHLGMLITSHTKRIHWYILHRKGCNALAVNRRVPSPSGKTGESGTISKRHMYNKNLHAARACSYSSDSDVRVCGIGTDVPVSHERKVQAKRKTNVFRSLLLFPQWWYGYMAYFQKEVWPLFNI